MSIQRFKATSPGRRDMSGFRFEEVTKDKPEKSLTEKLSKKGVVSDWREPNVIRIAPVPLYNSFVDAFNFGKILESSINE